MIPKNRAILAFSNNGGPMNSKLSLKNKNDQILIEDTKALVAQERQVLSDFLYHLREIENRKLFLKRGYPSLFAFMTQELKYSESAAGRRIQAMSLIKAVPEVEQQFKAGRISLSVAAQMQGFFRQENQKRRSERLAPISPQEKLELVSQLAGTSSRQCEQKLARISPETVLPRERIKPLTSEKTQIQFLANADLMEKIQRLKELTSHQNPDGKLEQVFAKAVDLALERLDPERKDLRRRARRRKQKQSCPATLQGKTQPVHGSIRSLSLPTSTVKWPATKTKPSRTLPTSGAVKNNRHNPQALRDRIWVRDNGQCQHIDPQTKRLCGSRRLVQVDHKYPFSLEPKHSEENLRLRCGAHNRLRWEEYERELSFL